MKVLHVMPSVERAFGGPVEALVGYARAAHESGHQNTIVAPGEPAAARWMAMRLPPETTVRVFGAVGRGSATLSVPLLRWLHATVREYDAVHVHGCFNFVSDLASGIVLRSNVPLIVRPFGTLSRYTFTHRNTTLKRLWFGHILRPCLARAERVHFTTREELEEAALTGLVFTERGVVIPPPLDELTGAVSTVERLAPVCLFLSRLHPKKNVEALLEGWVSVVRQMPAARLVIAGGGTPEYETSLRLRARELELEKSVQFEGFVQGAQKQALFDAARVFVLPSFQENFGVAVLEAMAAGMPVVISPEVQLASFVREHGLGVVTESAPAPLADALLSALRDDALLAHCMRDGRATVSEHFSVVAVGMMLDTLYRAVSKHRAVAGALSAGVAS
jgi:glycosyltransferase involved in cell wall biosynthesis